MLDGQMRALPGGILGWDMGAVLAFAGALGIDARAVGELLPAIEPVMARALTARIRNKSDG